MDPLYLLQNALIRQMEGSRILVADRVPLSLSFNGLKADGLEKKKLQSTPRKNPEISDIRRTAVIILKLEQYSVTILMQMGWQTV